MAESTSRQSAVTVYNYRLFFDRQREGHRASYGSVVPHRDQFLLLFLKASDGAKGQVSKLTRSADAGRTWSNPEPFGPPIAAEFPDCNQGLNLVTVTKAGTLLSCGYFIPQGIRENGNHEHYLADVAWRPCDALVGRQPADQDQMTWTRFPSGTFMGEQFLEPGLVSRTGRIILPLWGAKNKGDNWSCGVILSDDDGVTWRFRHVGLVADQLTRTNPAVPAGFNEQTLFQASDGTLISIIRGRERLGAADPQGRETYFFRSISTDDGETWSTPALTNLAGTGASHNSVTLADGSLLFCARIPHHPETLGVTPDFPQLCGLHIVRSFDHGSTWKTVRFIQHTPEGDGFDNYYNAMNGYFIPQPDNRWAYAFGHFDNKNDRHRILAFDIAEG